MYFFLIWIKKKKNSLLDASNICYSNHPWTAATVWTDTSILQGMEAMRLFNKTLRDLDLKNVLEIKFHCVSPVAVPVQLSVTSVQQSRIGPLTLSVSDRQSQSSLCQYNLFILIFSISS